MLLKELSTEVGTILSNLIHAFIHFGPEDASCLHLCSLLRPRVEIIVEARILAEVPELWPHNAEGKLVRQPGQVVEDLVD